MYCISLHALFDGLKFIEQIISPKIEKVLNEAGILNIEHLSSAGLNHLNRIPGVAGIEFGFHNPECYGAKAKFAAVGQ